MNLDFDINDLDFENIGQWPLVLKATISAIAFAGIIFAGYWFDTKKQYVQLSELETQEQELKREFEDKQQKTKNLEAYKKQMIEIEKTYSSLLRQLPEGAEVPGLVEDISHKGLESGLNFKSIKLRPEKKIDFYSELAMDIALEGSYHQLAEFVSSIANLPRIVTLHDMKIKNDSKVASQEKLMMEITAKTYRYVGEENE